MTLDALTAYAEEKYHMQEIHRWPDQPGLSVLQGSGVKEWAALLIRRYDPETGDTEEYADFRLSEPLNLSLWPPCITQPFRMHGKRWAGVSFTEDTDEDTVFRLFDRAAAAVRPQGYTVVLQNIDRPGTQVYHDTALPERPSVRPEGSSNSTDVPSKSYSVPADFFSFEEDPVPEMIKKLTQLFTYDAFSFHEKCKNFYLQAMFMKDYEDDAPWNGECRRFMTVYQDLTIKQLRGYFTWRTQLRHGNVQKISASLAAIYLYELLNGVGADEPEDCIPKMQAFEKEYLDAGFGDARMRENLHRWMADYCVLNDLPKDLALQCMDQETKEADHALAVLMAADVSPDRDVFEALSCLSHQKLGSSSAVKKFPEESARLFAAIWRYAAGHYSEKRKDLFTLCFGELQRQPWHPLSSAVWFRKEDPEPFDYALTECRRYLYQDGLFAVVSYQSFLFDKNRLDSLVRAADRRIREYLHSGNLLQAKPNETWAEPLIDAVLEADKKEKEEAARPKINIDFSDLSRIREDARVTRDSLLVEEENEEMPYFSNIGEESEAPEEPSQEAIKPSENLMKAASVFPVPLSEPLQDILFMVLSGTSPAQALKDAHLTASLAADAINEAFYDDIGDNILECENDCLIFTEDYREDVAALLGI